MLIFNYIPTQEEYLSNLAEYFPNVRGYNLFGHFVNLKCNRPNEIIENCQDDDNVTNLSSIRISLVQTIVLNESEIPAIQEEFAIVAAAHGWKTGHIDYRIFHPKLCMLSNLWLYHLVKHNESSK